jgi:hypothetical protein
MREKADSLVRETQDMRWQAARDTIQKALEEQYRLGFLDGEDAAKESQTEQDELNAAVEGAAV